MNKNLIGKGGGSNDVVEQDNNLLSIGEAQILDLLCEGEIEGTFHKDNALRDIFLDSTPIIDKNGNYNYAGVSGIITLGKSDQNFYKESFNYFNESFSTSVEYTKSIEVTHDLVDGVSINVAEGLIVNRLVINISIPSLYSQTDEGDTNRNYIALSINVDSLDISNNYTASYENILYGKCTSEYIYPVTFNIPEGYVTSKGWRVTVIKDSDDSVSSKNISNMYFKNVIAFSDDKFKYSNSSLAAIYANAKYFNSIPSRQYDLMLRKIQVPSNYTPTEYYRDRSDILDGSVKYAASYSGDWDGTFKDNNEWTDNPAWIFYDILTNKRFGLGNKIEEEQINSLKWELYQIGQYCDTVVTGRYITGLYSSDVETNYSNGYYEAIEPLYSCNAYIQTQQEAYQLLVDLASSFQSILYYGLGGLHINQDAYIDSSDPTLEYFTNANVKNGEFTYFGSSLSSIYTVALVTWCDNSDNGKNKIEYVEDAEGILQYGIREHEINAKYCISRMQAHRWGEKYLWINKNETEICSFSVGLEGHLHRVGEVIGVLDNDRAGLKRGGRILSVDKSGVEYGVGGIISIILDKPIEIKMDTVSSYIPNFQFGIARNFEGSQPGYLDRSSQIYSFNLTEDWWALNNFTYEGQVKHIQNIKFLLDSSYSSTDNEENFWGYQLQSSMIWIFANAELVSRKYKILNIVEDSDSLGEFVITCSPYDERKYEIDGKKIQYITQKTTRVADNFVLYTPIITQFTRNTVYSSISNTYKATDSLILNWKFQDGASLDPSLYSFKIYLYKDGSIYKTIDNTLVRNSFNYTIGFEERGCVYGVVVEAVYSFSSATRISTIWYYAVSLESQDDLPIVKGLSLVNNIVDNTNLQTYTEQDWRTFYGIDAQFSWKVSNNSITYELGETTAGADTVLQEAYFKTFDIKIFDINSLDDSQYVAEYTSTEPPWTYTFENNKKDGLRRNFVVQIALENTNGKLGVGDSINVYNKPPEKIRLDGIKCSYSKLAFNISINNLSDYDYAGCLLLLTPTSVINNLANLFKDWGNDSNTILNGLRSFIKDNPKNAFIFKNDISLSPLSLPSNSIDNWIDTYQFILIPFDRFAMGYSSSIENISVDKINLTDLNYSSIFYASSNTEISTNYFIDSESIQQSMLVKSLQKEINLISADETVKDSINYRINQLSGIVVSNDQSIIYQYENQIELSKTNGYVFKEPIKAAYSKYTSEYFIGYWSGDSLTVAPNQSLEDAYNISAEEADAVLSYNKKIGPTNPILLTGKIYDEDLHIYTTGIIQHYLQYGDLWVDDTEPKYINSISKNGYTRTYKWTGNYGSDWDGANQDICYWNLVEDLNAEVSRVALQEEKTLRNYSNGLLGGEYSVKIQTTDNGQDYIAGFGLSNYTIASSAKIEYKKYLTTVFLKYISKLAPDSEILANSPHEGFYGNSEYYAYSEDDSIFYESYRGRNLCYKNTTRSGSWFESKNETELWYMSDIEEIKNLYSTNTGEGYRQINNHDVYIKEDIQDIKYSIKGTSIDPLTGVYRNVWSEVDGSEFIIAADKFMILNPLTTGDVINPVFYVDTNEDKVYMHNAYIKSLEVDKLDAGYITAGLLVMDTLNSSSIVRTNSDVVWEEMIVSINRYGPYIIRPNQIIWVLNTFFEKDEIVTDNGYEGFQYIGEKDLAVNPISYELNNYVQLNPMNLLYASKDSSFVYTAREAIEKLLQIWKPLTSEIRSDNYRRDSENGFIIRSDGYCEFNNIKINARGSFKGQINTQKADILANNFNVLTEDDVFDLGFSLKIYLDSNFLEHGNSNALPYNHFDNSSNYSFEGMIRSRNLAWNYPQRAKLYIDQNSPIRNNPIVDGHDQNNEVLSIQHGRLWAGEEKYEDAENNAFSIDENGIMSCNQVNSRFKGYFYLNNNLNNIVFPPTKGWGDILGISKYEHSIVNITANPTIIPIGAALSGKKPVSIEITLKNIGSSFTVKMADATMTFKTGMEISANSIGRWATDKDGPCFACSFDNEYFYIYYRSYDKAWSTFLDGGTLWAKKSQLAVVVRALFIDLNY